MQAKCFTGGKCQLQVKISENKGVDLDKWSEESHNPKFREPIMGEMKIMLVHY